MNKIILLVEDDADEEALTLRALGKSETKADVVVVRDGAEVLAYLKGTGAYSGRDTSELPDLVLLDINIPKVGGVEVLRRLRAIEMTRALPVVILTSSDEDKDLDEGFASGANSYVCKPVNFDEFCQVIDQVLYYWLVLNQRPRGI